MNLIEANLQFQKLNQMLPNGENREGLSIEEEIKYVNTAFEIYESSGFLSELPDKEGYNEEDKPYIGKPFKVISRCKEPSWDLECLPAWTVEFEDGHRMEAYPEEICLLENSYL